ncbi:MAG: hypothetical protein DME26_23085 [Verrucomicrobia bacterium]|nr:MAG: hypothetical protein DME26_23085 [Verrucomicrobiota bacterium]
MSKAFEPGLSRYAKFLSAVCSATEWPKKIAHGASRGNADVLAGKLRSSERKRGLKPSLSPLPGLVGLDRIPTACAVGYHLALLRS